MSEFEEEVIEEFEEQESERPSPPLRNYEITMKHIDPKAREKIVAFGLLGLHPSGFALIQSTDGAMVFTANWENIWCVRAIPSAEVLSMVKH